MADRKQQAQQALQNPNVRAFLDLLAAAEGTEQHGYATAFGGDVLPSLADHPRQRKSFTQTDGKKNETTAAGRYQFLERTWDDVAGKLGLTDFGAEAQDLAAVELLRRAGALEPVLAGDFDTAVQKSGKTWASLPSSPYAQPKRSAEFIAARTPQNMTAAPNWLQEALKGQPGPTPPAELPPAPAGLPPRGVVPQRVTDATVPAAAPNAVQQLLASIAPASTAMTIAEEVPEPEFTPEDDELLAQGLTVENDNLRNAAVAKFFGEDPVPEYELPRPLEDSINRYLALL